MDERTLIFQKLQKGEVIFTFLQRIAQELGLDKPK